MSAERVRLFVALELPDEIRDALVAWRSREVGKIAGLRLLDPEQLHLTLCFLGWQRYDETQSIATACRELAAGPPLSLALGPPVWLPPRRPRVLAVCLDDASGELARLQSDLADRLQGGGWYVPEERPYMGHATVARARREAKLRPLTLESPPALPFTASRVTLFRSRLTAAGARYEPLATVTLG